ncbi:MAG TPA: helix-turn-helix domain-containing protein [Chloroflexia bacterium]|nr:helix-turn-helix domain-containing protein [Chloroflexia bacterium]
MSATLQGNRFASSTRGKIILLLRRSGLTVDELAQSLGLTDNAVRAHLTSLERDGLVEQRGVRRGQGKPSYCYYLTPDAEQLFPKPYSLVLNHTFDLLEKRLDPEEVRDMMRALGREIAGNQALRGDDFRSRVMSAAEVLNDLGGLAEMEEGEDEFRIRGYSCPVAEIVPNHPEVCLLIEALLTSWLDTSVQEECDRGTPLRCSFHIPLESTA